MVNKEDKREAILSRAFDVFVEKGYDKVSITTLQEHTKVSRGVLYSYFESKDGLFEAVMNKYMYRIMDAFFPKFDNEDVTISGRIDQLSQYLQTVSRFFVNNDNIDEQVLSYFTLFSQASKKYPALLKRLAENKKKYIEVWKNAVRKSIECGEIREDVDVDMVALHFYKISGTFDGIENLGKDFGQRAENDVLLMKQVLLLYR